MFFQLHRTEILEKPAYKRLVIGTIDGHVAQFAPRPSGSLSQIPYAVGLILTLPGVSCSC